MSPKIALSFLYLLFLIAFAFVPQTNAQDLTKSNNNFQNELHWDLSIDAYNLLKSGTPLMMLRYAKNPEKSALRLNVGFDYDNLKPSGKVDSLSPDITLYTQSTLNYLLEAGIEFRKSNGRFQLFYGPNASYSWYKQKNVPSDQLPETFETSTVTVGKIGAGAFVGVRYFVLKNLAISTETSLAYYAQRSKAFIGQNSNEAGVTRGYGIKFLPLNHLYISFFF
jgi:hypothetical protein